jgi:hypothetical protein
MTTPCAPGMCSRQADCGDLRCPGHPSQPQNRMSLGTHRIVLLDGVRIEPVPATPKKEHWGLAASWAAFVFVIAMVALGIAFQVKPEWPFN